MICAGTIEERIDELIEAKRGLATSIVDRGVEGAISELTDEELADLVRIALMMRPADLLHHLVELESPTGDAARIAHIGSFLAAELAALGGTRQPRGREPRKPRSTATACGLLLVAHMDTVWPAGTLQRMPFRIEGDLAWGPGALDMKGGIVVMLEAIRRAAPLARPVSVLITADEEIGSPAAGRWSSGWRPAPMRCWWSSRRCATPPSRRSGRDWPATSCGCDGEAAHAGHQGGGISAVTELAHQTLALCRLVDAERGVRVNVGQVGGGSGDNVVAAEAWARVDARAWTAAEQRAAGGGHLGLAAGARRARRSRSPAASRVRR